MGAKTKIEWATHTWNPWQGCHKVSDACANCYMYRAKKRYGQIPDKVMRSSGKTFFSPLLWQDKARVFTCSWSDWFIEEADAWRNDAWEVIRQTPHLTYLILTKRPENITARLPNDWGSGWPNVFLGVTTENQEMADKRIPILLQIPATKRFVSIEPMLNAVELRKINDHPKLNWVIVGSETGPGARPMHPDWARSVRDQCQAAGVPFFLKNMSKKEPIPKDLMIREFPKTT